MEVPVTDRVALREAEARKAGEETVRPVVEAFAKVDCPVTNKLPAVNTVAEALPKVD